MAPRGCFFLNGAACTVKNTFLELDVAEFDDFGVLDTQRARSASAPAGSSGEVLAQSPRRSSAHALGARCPMGLQSPAALPGRRGSLQEVLRAASELNVVVKNTFLDVAGSEVSSEAEGTRRRSSSAPYAEAVTEGPGPARRSSAYELGFPQEATPKNAPASALLCAALSRSPGSPRRARAAASSPRAAPCLDEGRAGGESQAPMPPLLLPAACLRQATFAAWPREKVVGLWGEDTAVVVKNTFLDLDDSGEEFADCEPEARGSRRRRRSWTWCAPRDGDSPGEARRKSACGAASAVSGHASSCSTASSPRAAGRAPSLIESSGSSDGTSPRGSLGHESRTTVILKSLSPQCSREALTELLADEGFLPSCDFLYVPLDLGSLVAFGYAFLNFAAPREAVDFLTTFNSGAMGPRGRGLKAQATAEWCAMQGLAEHVGRYRDSPLMHPKVPDLCKPVLFSDGARVAFPEPTRPIKAPRIRATLNRRRHVENRAQAT